MLKSEYTTKINLYDGTTETVDKEIFTKLSTGLICIPTDVETTKNFNRDELTGQLSEVIPIEIYDKNNPNLPPISYSIRPDLAIAIYNDEYLED